MDRVVVLGKNANCAECGREKKIWNRQGANAQLIYALARRVFNTAVVLLVP